MSTEALTTKMRLFQINFKDLFYLYIYIALWIIVAINLPKDVSIYYEAREALIGFAFLGTWRYSWWLVHVVRSLIYAYIVFPYRRQKADQLWSSGWRPKQLFFMMTTFKELQTTTETVLQSIVDEAKIISVPVKLFVGVGADSDEVIIKSFFAKCTFEFPFDIVMVQQKMPGKRFAIGETLRAMVKNGLTADDPVVFMDGDTFLAPGCLQKCLPFFPLFPNMQALTTHENAIVNDAPLWMRKWLDMRFVQRDFTMRSYSLSNKVLTLTGRMSIFRGKHLLEPEFIEIIEYDHLNHWLWGKYRFLSGDDKSTWYYLLKERAQMFYIPDATTTTIEYIKGNALDRMKENLRRWSGNTLRNGARAIALGPRTVGYFIWWCLVDQRIAIWTMPIGLMIILTLAFTKTMAFLVAYLLWIAFSRLCISLVLFYYAGRIDMSFPFLIYFNQLMSSLIKIYILFRLPQQRWSNRGDQKAGFEASKQLNVKALVANYLTFFYCMCFFILVLLYLDIISMPAFSDLLMLF